MSMKVIITSLKVASMRLKFVISSLKIRISSLKVVIASLQTHNYEFEITITNFIQSPHYAF